jgi:hypothetical protein
MNTDVYNVEIWKFILLFCCIRLPHFSDRVDYTHCSLFTVESLAIYSVRNTQSCIADDITDHEEKDVNCLSGMIEKNPNLILKKREGGQISEGI